MLFWFLSLLAWIGMTFMLGWAPLKGTCLNLLVSSHYISN